MKKIILPFIIMVSAFNLSACEQQRFKNLNYQKKVTLPTFDANFQYKRLIIRNSNGLLPSNNEAWIARSNTEDKSGQDIYYSSDGAVIRFDNGRFKGYSTATPIRNWRETTNTNIDWKSIRQGKPQAIKRCVIDHPKNEVDTCQLNILKLSTSAPANNQLKANLQDVVWIKEQPANTTDKDQTIYYAIKTMGSQPFYGQLYLDDTFKMTWQNWNVSK